MYIGFLKRSFSFCFLNFLFSSMNCTNSVIPPSNLNSNVFGFFVLNHLKLFLCPYLKSQFSHPFSNIEKLNLIDENISFDGTKLISVPLVFDFPTCFKEVLASPFLNSI